VDGSSYEDEMSTRIDTWQVR